jgi:hypothetical protein
MQRGFSMFPLDLIYCIENLTDTETTKFTEIINFIINSNDKTVLVVLHNGNGLLSCSFAKNIMADDNIHDFTHTRFFLSQTKETKEKMLANMFSLSEKQYHITLNVDGLDIRFKVMPKIFYYRDSCYRFVFAMPESENQQRIAQKTEFDYAYINSRLKHL